MGSAIATSCDVLDDVSQNGAVGQGDYEVQQGDCMDSIGCQFGFSWEALWNLPENAELKRARKDPNVLMPGDRVFIPPLRVKEVSADTDKRHRFVRKGVPARFVMCFFEDGEPLAGESYILKIDGTIRSGQLDSNGRLSEVISPDAKVGELIIGEDDPIPLQFGTLDPITAVSGIQGRLRNLGFSPGAIDGVFGPKTRVALQAFQAAHKLEVNGKIDAATRDKLIQIHGS